MLASGGNDNKLFIWDQRHITSNSRESSYPALTFDRHTAAVKAIAWHPTKHRVLASGGGTADKHIRFWDVSEGKSMGHHNTESQVCNIAWHKTTDQLVSSHGYSNNHVQVWKFDYGTATSNVKLAEGSYKQVLQENASPLTAHSMRVLYMAMSPDGENIVTGAGDETLRFWRVFEKASALKSDEDNLRPDTVR
ncbi:hypothetical protein HDV00_002580 [Rhizophlyctis rosea]|nr:hypothetical protein HDV00_002580 [Rhizophlyctis rosea]